MTHHREKRVIEDNTNRKSMKQVVSWCTHPLIQWSSQSFIFIAIKSIQIVYNLNYILFMKNFCHAMGAFMKFQVKRIISFIKMFNAVYLPSFIFLLKVSEILSHKIFQKKIAIPKLIFHLNQLHNGNCTSFFPQHQLRQRKRKWFLYHFFFSKYCYKVVWNFESTK